MDVLWLFLALEEVEERVAGDRLHDDSLLTSLLVLLRLLYLLLGRILALFPLDDGALNLDSLVSVIVHNGSEAQGSVGEKLVLAELHGHGKLGGRQLDLAAVKFRHVLKDRLVLLSDDGLEHSVVLDGLGPVIGDTGLFLKVLDICGFVGFLFFRIGLLLFVGLNDTGNSSLDLSEGRIELNTSIIEGGVGTSDDFVALSQDRQLTLLECLGKLAHFLLELIVNLATLIRVHVKALEALLHVRVHL